MSAGGKKETKILEKEKEPGGGNGKQFERSGVGPVDSTGRNKAETVPRCDWVTFDHLGGLLTR